jgi:hypothetical protein
LTFTACSLAGSSVIPFHSDMHNHWQYVQWSEVDPLKWNDCICTADNGHVYALVEFLNHTAHKWDALIYGNYEFVMPLPWKKKYGIRYVYSPPFIQQLGVFGKNVDPVLSAQALDMASTCFHYIDYKVNDSFNDEAEMSTVKTNYVVDLDRNYESIREGYTTQCVSNLQKADRRGCELEETLPVSEVIRLFRAAYGSMHSANQNDYDRFEKLMNNPMDFKVHSFGVREKQTNELLCGALILQFRNRLYYAMAAPTEKGRNARATYFFIDQMIRRFAGSGMIFDFEGSELPNVAAFYQRFGPAKEQYTHVKINNLPWLVKLFKS